MELFNAETHEYFKNGQRVYSVTQIMKPITAAFFAHIPTETLQAKARLGTYVHELCEVYDNGEMGDESEIHPTAMPYFLAYKQFLSDTGFHVVDNEKRLFHPRKNYAGTIDRTGYLDGKLILLDIKTSATMGKHTGIQLAAYSELLISQNNPAMISEMVALQLKPNGTYKLHDYTDPNFIKDFLILLNFHHLTQKYGDTK
jgi:hypothetical protein